MKLWVISYNNNILVIVTLLLVSYNRNIVFTCYNVFAQCYLKVLDLILITFNFLWAIEARLVALNNLQIAIFYNRIRANELCIKHNLIQVRITFINVISAIQTNVFNDTIINWTITITYQIVVRLYQIPFKLFKLFKILQVSNTCYIIGLKLKNNILTAFCFALFFLSRKIIFPAIAIFRTNHWVRRIYRDLIILTNWAAKLSKVANEIMDAVIIIAPIYMFKQSTFSFIPDERISNSKIFYPTYIR